MVSDVAQIAAVDRLLDASRTPAKVHAFWPVAAWWERTGWEAAAELAAASLGLDVDGQLRLISWVAAANPEVACKLWCQSGQPAMPEQLRAALRNRWLPRMIDQTREPHPAGRAAIGRALARFGLDNRPGIGLTADGLPDIAWIRIPSSRFIYQETTHPALPEFLMARYPITYAQFDAFIRAGGYQDGRWWTGLAERVAAPSPAAWTESNAPRETVSWYEAVAFCRWLGAATGRDITLPTEPQWERAARGIHGSVYPWGGRCGSGQANIDEIWGISGTHFLERTTTPGIYPAGASPEGVEDLTGNVLEWCRNAYHTPDDAAPGGSAARATRGGSWNYDAEDGRSAARFALAPDLHQNDIGFRVVSS